MVNEKDKRYYKHKCEVCINWIAEKIMEDASEYGMEPSFEKALETANNIVDDEMKWREVNENVVSTRSSMDPDRVS